MTFGDAVRLALRNLLQARLRTILTSLGVAIGVASLAGMVSLGLGLQEQTVGQFRRSGIFDAVTVTPARAFGRPFGGRGPALRSAVAAPAGQRAQRPSDKALDAQVLSILAALPHVKEVYPNLRVPVDLQLGSVSEFATALGVPMSARDEGAFQSMAFGQFFPNDSDNTCLLSLDLAKRLTDSDPKTLLGRALSLAYVAAGTGPNADAKAAGTPPAGAGVPPHRVEVAFRIVGIVEREPNPLGGGGFGSSGLMIPEGRARAIDAVALSATPADLLGGNEGGRQGEKTYTSVTVKVDGAESTEDVEDRVKALGYSAFSLADALQAAKRGFLILDIMLSLIGSIALAVSSLGIVNTMVMSILERTREIGVMKAIGGGDRDIRRIFLVEASAIGILGGAGGVALGWLVGRLINLGANIYIESQGGSATQLFALPFWLVAGAIGFSWLVSLIAGSYPAARAARLDPIQALRHD